MAHKTLINGTAYEVSGGRTLVNGTGYKIDKGRTLVNGTGYDISFLPAIGTSLNNMSWADIRKVSDAGMASNYFSIGDLKAVTLNGTVGNCTFSNATYYCYIIGINHNSSIEGANRIHFQFGYTELSGGKQIAFTDSAAIATSDKTSGTWFNMYNTRYNSGGWESSRMRTIICPAFQNAMPSDLRSVLKTVLKYTDNKGGGSYSASNVTATTETIFLPAMFEVTGKIGSANQAEQNYQERYTWYANGNSLLRYSHSSIKSDITWWFRSVRCDSDEYFIAVYPSNTISAYNASRSNGFAPIFCV